MFGRDLSASMFHHSPRADHSMVWRYLTISEFRQNTHQRWSTQAPVVTLVEVAAVIFSMIIQLAVITGGCYLLWQNIL